MTNIIILCDSDADGNIIGTADWGKHVIPQRSYHHCISQAFDDLETLVVSDMKVQTDAAGYAYLVKKEAD